MKPIVNPRAPVPVIGSAKFVDVVGNCPTTFVIVDTAFCEAF
jgi:hypothetical protein